ncbi:hypothetical protein MRB53_020261 [Persea americana]|uniref:Uncharacterized protein n=1 Tax=Persea americana TaxID=3435 RepID=A0ACC2L1P0_PERAE|nr:hypothetical protein MRB53_020261 [Persea americana]
MEGERGRSHLQSLLQAIKSSKDRESRISLINQLGDVGISGKSDLALLAESLTEPACSGISQCSLNNAILHLAAKYLEMDTTSCLRHFLILGTKASMWCEKHLQMTTMSVEEYQEENHARLFFQLVLDSLSFSSTTISALTNSPVFEEKELMLIVENFILQQLNLTKASISEMKRFHSIASEVLKVTQVVLDAAIRLCRAYAQDIEWGSTEAVTNEDEGSTADGRVNNMAHVINIITCAIENLYDLGILAASGGGSLVTILNISWKGVVTLLQLGKGVLADKINIGDFILSLISLATESLRCAAGVWSSSSFMETLAVAEAKRTFLPIKFYLINAVRICSQYPCQALVVYKEIGLCVLMISTFGISLTKESHLKAASEVLAEFLEPTSFLLLLTLINSDEVKNESKLQILDWLFTDASHLSSMHPEEILNTCTDSTTSIYNRIFTVTCGDMPRARTLMLGRLSLFLNIIKVAPDLKEEVVLGISTRLKCLLDILVDAEIYSSILVLQIPVLCGSGTTAELVWNPLFPFILHALKTFMVVAALSPAWGEVESFLLANFLHPHFLCWEIIMDLWCFLIRHAETDMINDSIDRLLSLFKMMASSEPALLPGCSLRRMARSVCMLLHYAAPSTIDRVYTSIFSDDKSHLAYIMYTALLVEGFPLISLSDNLIKIAHQRILSAFFCFIENSVNKLGVDNSWRPYSSGVLGVVSMYALSTVLQSLQISSSDLDDKNFSRVLKFTVAVIQCCQNATNGSDKDQLSKILGQTLEIISHTNHLFASDEMEEVILELRKLFAAGSSATETWLYQCKPALASFMAGLSRMQMAEGEGSETCSAVWELYHTLLRERHWAFVHLALASFEYFAARSSCDQLWRFVPPDAALSCDMETGNEAREDQFMSEFKGFLEKEAAVLTVTPCSKQLSLLEKEGLVLKETIGKHSNIEAEVSEQGIVEITSDNHIQKKRKLPDGINEGMALLQSGLKAVGDGLALWKQQSDDSKELQDELSSQLLCLEGVISHLVGLADSG